MLIMMDDAKILVINVGSTSTKIAFFNMMTVMAEETIVYGSEELVRRELKDQLPLREKDVLSFISGHNVKLKEIDIIIARGGVGKPGPSGIYKINEKMCNDLMTGRYALHPSALGPAIALNLSKKYGIAAIVADPPSTDEFHQIARISGLPEIERKSGFHALNQKAAARRAAAEIGKRYEDVNLIVAHLGGGITIGAHRMGKVIDCTHGLSEGPFTPERAGGLPTMDLIDLAFSGKYTREQMQKRLAGQGGLFAYLSTTDAREVEKIIKGGNKRARMVYRAMAYQIAKEIGAFFVVLKGRIDGTVLTGGLARSKMLTDWIVEWIDFLAPVFIYSGEDEMKTMAQQALRVLRGEEEVKEYQ